MTKRLTFALVVVLALVGIASARPGGGDTYSGGGGHGGSGGGGGDSGAIFELLYWLLRLIIYYPQHIDAPVTVGTVGGGWIRYT